MGDLPNQLTKRRRRRFAAGAAVLLVLATAGAAAVDADGKGSRWTERADVAGQGGEGVHQRNGARLTRTDHSVHVDWDIRTLEPGSYQYPTPDMVPPGAPIHPPITPGYPEVFTLWMFLFNYPDLCTDQVCDADDIGPTDAQGSVYQLDGVIAHGHRTEMGASVRLGQSSINGVVLSNPLGAEVHVAMAPHGTALEGAELVHQLNSGVGGPPLWFAALFFPNGG